MQYLLVLLPLAAAGWGYWTYSRRRARDGLLQSPLTGEQRAIIARQVPLTRRLPPGLRARLEG